MKQIEQPQFLRTAALTHFAMGISQTKVIFEKGKRDKYGNPEEEKAYWMSKETYRAIPHGVDATPEDYAEFGEIIEANNTDIYDIEAK